MIKKKSFGKINLSLEVVGKREDGYHNIDTLMNRIDLFDEIEFSPISENKLILKSDNEDFPTDSSNLMYKAWEIMSKYKKSEYGMEIYVKKNIPIAAGLAGGTSNGIETIKVLNEIWDLGFSKDELIQISKPLGADSTFFFYDNLVRAKGIGEKIQEIKQLENFPILLINIGKPISSKEVYENMKSYSEGKVSKIVENIDDFHYLKENVFNSMEDVSFNIYPELKDTKERLKISGADISLMSGSGPSIFGIYKDRQKRDEAYNQMKNDYKYVIKTKII